MFEQCKSGHLHNGFIGNSAKVQNSFRIGTIHNLKCRLTCRPIYAGIIDKFSLGYHQIPLWLPPTRNLNRFPKLLFTTSVWPSIWGSDAELNCKLLSNFFHETLQKWLKNLVYLSLVMVFAISCNRTTSLKNKCATWLASFVLLEGMKWASLEKQCTTTNKESWPLWVCGSLKTKSMEILVHGSFGTGQDIQRHVFYCPPFPFGTPYKQ